jgi:hypothetical protein
VASAALAAESAPERALMALIAAHLGWIEDHQALARYLFGSLPDEVLALAEPPLAAHNARFFAVLDALYQRLARAGFMGALDRSTARALCIGPAQEYGRQWTRGMTKEPPRKRVRVLQRAALAALATTISNATKGRVNRRR